MIPRTRLDIDWTDLFRGICRCFIPGNRRAKERRIEECWSSSSDTVVFLSVRSGFDLLFDALNLPAGSEVLVSALNIRSMFDVLKKHRLVAVPIDLDMSTLAMKADELECAVNSNTRVILAAQLFGSRRPLDDVVEFARQHGLLVIEDCAQGYTGDGYLGHSGSDVVMVSFGPIKTCSTIMGGIFRISNHTLCNKVKSLQAKLPIHSRWDYLKWLGRFAVLKLSSTRVVYRLLLSLALRQGQQANINNAVRIFGGSDEFIKFRKQPSYPMLALLESRLKRFDVTRIERRRAAAETVIQRMPFIHRPGENVAYHTHWIFPIEVTSPVKLMEHLRSLGFDSINGYSSFIVPDPPEQHPEFQALEARRMMHNVLYLPVHTGLSERELIRLATAVTEFELAERERASRREGNYDRLESRKTMAQQPHEDRELSPS